MGQSAPASIERKRTTAALLRLCGWRDSAACISSGDWAAAGARKRWPSHSGRSHSAMSGKSAKTCQARFAKIILLPCRANHLYRLAPSRPSEGRIAIVTYVGRDAVDAAASSRAGIAGRVARPVSDRTARGRTAQLRTAKPCGPGTRCWCQAGGGFSSPTGSGKTINPLATVARRIRHRGATVFLK